MSLIHNLDLSDKKMEDLKRESSYLACHPCFLGSNFEEIPNIKSEYHVSEAVWAIYYGQKLMIEPPWCLLVQIWEAPFVITRFLMR
jgi:hypothetical protein